MSNDGKSLDIQRFGRYLLLDHLVDGGMAKICRARFLGEQANKIVAIKMIQEQYSRDAAFVQMFRDELKVTFGLIHPNIAQTYDYGEVDHILYTAMEYVDGANLKQFLDRLKKRKFVFPVEISTYIVSQVCQALFYAHTFTDKLTGKSYNIIHRDISPHNIMITYDGAVKVIDFGIAKAETNSEATQAGTIKGKLSYLAPEYLEGLELDHRYDQFAVGITLWEMLCSRKLFTAPNDLAVLKQIQACKVAAPSSINPNVPKELDEIVLQALSKDRNNRFKDMDALNRALVRFLYAKYPDFNATDLSFFAKELFKEDIVLDRERLKEYGKIDIKPFINDYENSYQAIPQQSVDASTVEALIVTKKEGTIEFDMAEGEKAEFDFTRSMRRNTFNKNIEKENNKVQTVLRDNKKVNRNLRKTRAERDQLNSTRTQFIPQKGNGWLSKIAVMLIIGFGVFYYMRPTEAKRFIHQIAGLIKGQVNAGRDLASCNPKKDPDCNQSKKEFDPGEVKPEIEEVPQTVTGKVFFEGYEPGMNIIINGEKVTYSLWGIEVPLNEKIRVEISKKNHASLKKTIKLTEEESKYNFMIPALRISDEGLLSSKKKYPKGTYFVYSVDSKRYKKRLPLKNYRMPAGIYDGVIYNKKHKINKRVLIKIEKDKHHILK